MIVCLIILAVWVFNITWQMLSFSVIGQEKLLVKGKRMQWETEENGVMSFIICFTTKYFEEDETKGDEMSRTSSRHGSDGRRLQYFNWKTWKGVTTLKSSVYVG